MQNPPAVVGRSSIGAVRGKHRSSAARRTRRSLPRIRLSPHGARCLSGNL